MADNPDQKIELKTPCSEIINDHQMQAKEQSGYKEFPVISDLKQQEILNNYLQIKKDIQAIIELEIERMLDIPELTDLIITKK